jgi:hypothetical protein
LDEATTVSFANVSQFFIQQPSHHLMLYNLDTDSVVKYPRVLHALTLSDLNSGCSQKSWRMIVGWRYDEIDDVKITEGKKDKRK